MTMMMWSNAKDETTVLILMLQIFKNILGSSWRATEKIDFLSNPISQNLQHIAQ